MDSVPDTTGSPGGNGGMSPVTGNGGGAGTSGNAMVPFQVIVKPEPRDPEEGVNLIEDEVTQLKTDLKILLAAKAALTPLETMFTRIRPFLNGQVPLEGLNQHLMEMIKRLTARKNTAVLIKDTKDELVRNLAAVQDQAKEDSQLLKSYEARILQLTQEAEGLQEQKKTLEGEVIELKTALEDSQRKNQDSLKLVENANRQLYEKLKGAEEKKKEMEREYQAKLKEQEDKLHSNAEKHHQALKETISKVQKVAEENATLKMEKWKEEETKKWKAVEEKLQNLVDVKEELKNELEKLQQELADKEKLLEQKDSTGEQAELPNNPMSPPPQDDLNDELPVLHPFSQNSVGSTSGRAVPSTSSGTAALAPSTSKTNPILSLFRSSADLSDLHGPELITIGSDDEDFAYDIPPKIDPSSPIAGPSGNQRGVFVFVQSDASPKEKKKKRGQGKRLSASSKSTESGQLENITLDLEDVENEAMDEAHAEPNRSPIIEDESDNIIETPANEAEQMEEKIKKIRRKLDFPTASSPPPASEVCPDPDSDSDESVVDLTEYEVERITGRRKNMGKLEYLVKWTGWEKNCSSWEPIENLKNSLELVREFERKPRGVNTGAPAKRSRTGVARGGRPRGRARVSTPPNLEGGAGSGPRTRSRNKKDEREVQGNSEEPLQKKLKPGECGEK